MCLKSGIDVSFIQKFMVKYIQSIIPYMYSKINNLSIILYDLPSKFQSEREVLFMARHGENIYKRKDGRWEGRYIKGFDAEGKAKPGYVYG